MVPAITVHSLIVIRHLANVKHFNYHILPFCPRVYFRTTEADFNVHQVELIIVIP